MSTKSGIRALLVAALWLSLIGVLAVSYRYFVSAEWKDSMQGTPELSAKQWRTLPPADLRTKPIIFARGSAELSDESRRELRDLCETLKHSPHTYLRAIGEARPSDDSGEHEANQNIARARAQAVVDFLAYLDINRLRLAMDIEDGGDGTPTVRFETKELR
jgi:outer membrane protein OmpA-like peptidoglycan-associated protein